MQSMIEIEGRIVASDILTEYFCCDLQRCKGICCVEGNAGAPLEKREVAVLETEYSAYKPYMNAEGISAVQAQGFAVLDLDGDLTTPLIDDAQCAFSFMENGITFCAIERAFKEGRTDFIKPISCHLYPIRVKKFRDGSEGLNYHRWSVCSPAVKSGRQSGIRVYRALKEPLVRVYGEEFYNAMDAASEFLSAEEGQ